MRNEEMLARLILCVEHRARAMLPEYVICEMAEIIERVTGQPCAPGGAIELASRSGPGGLELHLSATWPGQ